MRAVVVDDNELTMAGFAAGLNASSDIDLVGALDHTEASSLTQTMSGVLPALRHEVRRRQDSCRPTRTLASDRGPGGAARAGTRQYRPDPLRVLDQPWQ